MNVITATSEGENENLIDIAHLQRWKQSHLHASRLTTFEKSE